MAFDKQKALETAMSQIEKQFGKGAVMRLGQRYMVLSRQERLLLHFIV